MLMCAATLCLTSCTKDKNELLQGSWERVSMEWVISGDPTGSHNAHVGPLPMKDVMGAGYMRVFFYEDNTGMIIDDYLSIKANPYNISDTLHFTYSINGNTGITSTTDTCWEGGIPPTFYILNIKKDAVTLYEKSVMKDFWGSGYDRVQETYHHFKKI